MRTTALFLAAVSMNLSMAQTAPLESTQYLLLDTSRVKWVRPSQVCGNGRVELRSAYILERSADHQEFTRLLRRTMKSQRRYERTLLWFFSKQKDRRWARVEKFMFEHHVGTMELTDGSVLVLKQATRRTNLFSYQLFGEEHHYSLIDIDALLLTTLGGVSYQLSPLN